jgi:hypothetical protein
MRIKSTFSLSGLLAQMDIEFASLHEQEPQEYGYYGEGKAISVWFWYWFEFSTPNYQKAETSLSLLIISCYSYELQGLALYMS